MKKIIMLLLCFLLLFSQIPGWAASDALEVMGGFQGRLLAEEYNVTYDLKVENNTQEAQNLSVIFASYVGEQLLKTYPYSLPVAIGERVSKTYTLSDVTSDVTKVRAFVLNSVDAVQPLVHSDSLSYTYDSIYNTYGHQNLVTELEEGYLSEEALQNRFGVTETFRTFYQSAYINGASMVAFYETAPTEFYVGLDRMENYSSAVAYEQFRTARVIDPDGNVCAYYDFSEDYDVNTAGEEITACGVILTVPESSRKPGLWTISYVGGNGTCDKVTIGAPVTPYWGLRGEMFLGFNADTQKTAENAYDRKWYIYVPESCVGADATVLVANNYLDLLPTITKANGETMELLRSQTTDDAHPTGIPATFGPTLHAKMLITRVTEEDAGKIWTLDLDAWKNVFWTKETDHNYSRWSSYWHNSGDFKFNGIYLGFVNGLPGLVCPTEAAAEKLKGGVSHSADDRTLGGVVQARARDIGVSIVNENDLTVSADFADEMPQAVEENAIMGVEAITGGREIGVGRIADFCAKQNLDPDDIFLGSLQATEFASAGHLGHRDNYEDFVYSTDARDIYSSGYFAAGVGLPTKLNAVYGNQALALRTALSILSHITEMSPEGLLRGYGVSYNIMRDDAGAYWRVSETDDNQNGMLDDPVPIPAGTQDCWPCVRVFFTYPNLAISYNLIKDKVTPEIADVMRDGLLLLGDKLANYQSNDTNQWTEILKGHFETYMATGEERFLRYFERAAATLKNKPVTANSVGQNDAGAFLEQMSGSDGYAPQVMHHILPCYYTYRDLPEKNQEAFQSFEEAVQKAVLYEALNWLPVQKNGRVISPTAVVTKGNQSSYGVRGGSYPSFSLASVGFPIAARLYELDGQLPTRTTNSEVDLYYRYEDAAKGIVEREILGVQNPLQAYTSENHYAYYSGPATYEVFSQQPWCSAGNTLLPVEETDKEWLFDELYAWKKNGIYAMTFYANSLSSPGNIYAPNGYDAVLSSRGGLPFAVWSEGTGPVVLAQDIGNVANAMYSGVIAKDGAGTLRTTKHFDGVISNKTDSGYTITQSIGTISDKVIGTITYDVVYQENGFSIDVNFTPAVGEENYQEAYIQLPITSEYKSGVTYSELSVINNEKTFRYRSTLENAYGYMDIHTDTGVIFDTSDANKQYGTTLKSNVLQYIKIPLVEGRAKVTFEIGE